MEPIIIERTYNAPIAKVWKAITNNDDMKQWYFQIADFKPVIGFEFTFEGGNEGKMYVHICKVTEVIAEKKISYTWRYKGYEGVSEVTFELFTEGNKTKLKLTHAGLETFPQNIPDFARHNFEQGWTAITGVSLTNHLEVIPK